MNTLKLVDDFFFGNGKEKRTEVESSFSVRSNLLNAQVPFFRTHIFSLIEQSLSSFTGPKLTSSSAAQSFIGSSDNAVKIASLISLFTLTSLYFLPFRSIYV